MTRTLGCVFVLAAVATTSTALGAQPRQKRKPVAPAPAVAAKPAGVEVVVRESAGSLAYLEPGERGGVVRGAKVTLAGKEYTVVQSTSSFAVIDVGDDVVQERAKGQATLVTEEVQKPKELPPPRPLSTWERAWTDAPPPASAETPKYVPLGGGAERDRKWDVRLSTAAGAILPLGARGAGIGHAELDARIHAEPFTQPFAFDLDLSLQRWAAANLSARDGAGARPTLSLRELLFSYAPGGFYAGVGRMRYAASTLGALDGARVRAPLGEGFSVGAFGGFLPDPLGGAPATDAQRFGAELAFSRPESELRPEAALVLHGSTFGGSLDERRISGVVGLYPGAARLGGHFEVSSFPSDNPWRASPIALSAAGVDASVRFGIFQVGARVDVRQPERSRWLASYLPLTWFCRPIPAPAGSPPGPEICDGSVSTRALGAIDGGVELGPVSLVVGGTKTADLTQSGGAPDMTGAFAAGRVARIARIVRVDATLNYSRATYIDMYGGTAGPGVTLFADVLDVSAYYRYETLKYRSVASSQAQSGFGGTAMLFPNAVFLFTVQGEALSEADVKAFMVLGTATWRPRF
jgi:hypothetical protein